MMLRERSKVSNENKLPNLKLQRTMLAIKMLLQSVVKSNQERWGKQKVGLKIPVTGGALTRAFEGVDINPNNYLGAVRSMA